MQQKLTRAAAGKPLQRPVRILQFGEGNFLRAFADWMVDILNEKSDFNSAIQVIQPISRGMAQAINSQEGLYHLVLNGISRGKPVRDIRLITCVKGAINPYEDYQAFLSTAENPDLLFVISNTTEAGIAFSAEDRDLKTPADSFPGKLTALLYHRYQLFGGDPRRALTLLPCELIERNGEALRNAVLQYIRHWNLGDGFRDWITDHTLFCNTLVDRIVPGYPKDTAKDICEETGFEDSLIVSAEPFHLWVIEPVTDDGHLAAELKKALPLDKAGLQVKFVQDLTPYRTRKVRILNGAHTAMVPVGYLRGLRTVREVIDDGFAGDFIRKAIDEEIIPTLDLSRDELHQFANDVIERFQNPFIRHELMSIALNSVSKFQVRVLPSILEYIRRTGKLPSRLLYSLAALILFYKGEWQGQEIQLNDTPSVLAFFKDAWSNADHSAVVQQVLSNEELWQTDLTRIAGLGRAVTNHMAVILKAEPHPTF